MKTFKWILSACLLTSAAVIVVPASAQNANDSAIVQAAKDTAKERASDKKKTTRVYTNDDFSQRHEQPPDSANGTAATGTPGANKPGDAAKSVNDNQKLKDLQKKLAESKGHEQDLRRQLDTLQKKADVETSVDRRNMYLEMISDQQTTLAEYRRTQNDLEKQIEEEKKAEEKNKESQK